jgi:hypothetical protein
VKEVSDGFKVRLEMILDQVFRRRCTGPVAARLLGAATSGTTDLADLTGLATSALHELADRRLARSQ